MKDGKYSKNELNRNSAKGRRIGQLRSSEIMLAARKQNTPKSIVYGPRERFLAKYRVEGFDKAKEEISNFEYEDEILNKWIEEDSKKVTHNRKQ